MHSIKLKITLLFFVIITVSSAILGSTLLIKSKTALTKSVMETLKSKADNIASKIEDENIKQLALLEALASYPDVQSEELDIAQKNEKLMLVNSASAGVNNVSYFDKDGSCLIMGMLLNFKDDELYIREGLAGRQYVSPPRFGGEQILLFYETPVTTAQGKNNGLLTIVADGYKMSGYVEQIVVGKESHPLVIDRASGVHVGDVDSERLIASMTGEYLNPTDDSFGNLAAAYKDMLKGCEGSKVYNDPDTGVKMICYYRPVGPSCSWSVFCSAPFTDFFGDMDVLQNYAVLICLIIAVISFILSSLFAAFILKPLGRVRDSFNDIATGNADLTKRIDLSTKGEIGEVVKGFNDFSAKLQEIIGDIKSSKGELSQAGDFLESSTEDTKNSIGDILNDINSIHLQVEEQNNCVTETAGAVNEIASNIESLEKMIENQSREVSDASAAVEEMVGNIMAVNGSVEKMADSFNSLSSSAKNGSNLQNNVYERISLIKRQSETLQEANDAIAAIAEQTNLLAMNAAIESAHAGEAGKGFAVVADEIRKLSETSTSQSATIGEQLTAIQESINSVVEASNQSNIAFQTVISKIDETDEIVRQIKGAMEEQNEGSHQISNALHSMNNSTMEVKIASREMAEGNKQILNEIQHLQSTTGEINSSMTHMNDGAKRIADNGNSLSEISEHMKDSIAKIGSQIDRFEV